MANSLLKQITLVQLVGGIEWTRVREWANRKILVQKDFEITIKLDRASKKNFWGDGRYEACVWNFAGKTFTSFEELQYTEASYFTRKSFYLPGIIVLRKKTFDEKRQTPTPSFNMFNNAMKTNMTKDAESDWVTKKKVRKYWKMEIFSKLLLGKGIKYDAEGSIFAQFSSNTLELTHTFFWILFSQSEKIIFLRF